MMNDLTGWLQAQLDDDERAARLVAECGLENIMPSAVIDRTGATVFFTDEGYELIRRTLDPARKLAEVDAKRRILDWAEGALDVQDDYDPVQTSAAEDGRHVLRLLALPYADRPGYRDEWRPTTT